MIMAVGDTSGGVTPRLLGLGLAGLMACLWLAIYLLLRKVSAKRRPQNQGSLSDEESSNLRSAVRRLQRVVFVLPILLIVGLYMTRGAAIGPRLTGAAINLAFTFWFIFLIRRGKKRLQERRGN
jgi:hypothetical protein